MEKKTNAIKIKIIGSFASFKPEKDQRYHRTYEIPPKTTLLGFVGAALGLKDIEIYENWKKGSPLVDRIKVAVNLNDIGGRIKETWTINKFIPAKGRGGLPKIEPSPITREQLYRPSYTIYVAQKDSNSDIELSDIQRAIENPTYPLSLGRDDELIQIEEIQPVELDPKTPPIFVYNTLLPFDLIDKKKSIIFSEGDILKPHLVQRLPHRFFINDGIRNVNPKDIGKFTFLTGYSIEILEKIDAYSDIHPTFTLGYDNSQKHP